MEWLAWLPNLNPVDHVSEAQGRRIAAVSQLPETFATLETSLQEVWLLVPTKLVDHIMNRISHPLCAALHLGGGGCRTFCWRYFSCTKLIYPNCSFHTYAYLHNNCLIISFHCILYRTMCCIMGGRSVSLNSRSNFLNNRHFCDFPQLMITSVV